MLGGGLDLSHMRERERARDAAVWAVWLVMGLSETSDYWLGVIDREQDAQEGVARRDRLIRLLVDTLDDVGLVSMHARAEAHGWPIDALEGELAKRGLS